MVDFMTKKISTTAALIANSKAIKSLKAIFVIFFAVITIFGLVTFPQFLLEEAFQCCQFAEFAALSAKDWPLVLEGVDTMAKINKLSKTVNRTAGWINPLSYLSYRSYTKASDYYIKTITARVLANEPSLFIGRRVKFTFKPQQTESLSDGNFAHVNRNLKVITSNRPGEDGYISAVGTLNRVGNKLTIDMTKKDGAK